MSNYYRFIYFNSSRDSFRSVSSDSVISANYSDIFVENYPLTSSITTEFFPNPTNPSSSTYSLTDVDRLKIKALKPTFYKYKKYSPLFEYSSSYADYENDDITLVNIPSIFYGQSLEKGSIKLSVFSDGILTATAEDTAKNGVLYQTFSRIAEKTPTREVGLVFYDEGIILLFSNARLTSYKEDVYSTPDNITNIYDDYIRWNNWGISLNASSGSVIRTSYDIEFNGVNKIPQMTMLAHADIASINSSNNRTFVEYGQSNNRFITGSNSVIENNQVTIKNIVKTDYVSPEPAFHKETYISKILIYDEDKNIIGIAKLATPVRKTEDRAFTFKLKLNL